MRHEADHLRLFFLEVYVLAVGKILERNDEEIYIRHTKGNRSARILELLQSVQVVLEWK